MSKWSSELDGTDTAYQVYTTAFEAFVLPTHLFLFGSLAYCVAHRDDAIFYSFFLIVVTPLIHATTSWLLSHILWALSVDFTNNGGAAHWSFYICLVLV